jgi:hypothetical protein
MGEILIRPGYAQRRLNTDAAQARAAWLMACDLAATEFGGDVRKVLQGNGRRGRTVDDLTARCRKVACYLVTVVANASPERVAEATGLNRSTIHKHAAWVEDRRDDGGAFDAQIERLEMALVLMCARVVLARLGVVGADGVAA